MSSALWDKSAKIRRSPAQTPTPGLFPLTTNFSSDSTGGNWGERVFRYRR